MDSQRLKVTDVLCGLGGVTAGVEESDNAIVQEAINHNPHAIAINRENHPNVKFYIEDLYEVQTDRLNNTDIFVAGVECTNHSNAKGGMSREADSRAMANELFRYVDATNPNYLIVENVREFKDWGPLITKRINGVVQRIKKGKNKGKAILIPDPSRKGRYFHKWKYKMMEKFKFYHERMINAADYGAATSRIRLFIIFTNDPNFKWPEPTHSKEGSNGLFGLKKWVSCSKFIDLKNHGKSIFGRVRKDGTPNPLAENTLARIAYGIKKYGLKHNKFLIKYYGTGNNVADIDDPLATITTKDRHAIVTTDQFYVQNYHNTNSAGSVDEPLKTIVTKDEKAFITIEKMQFIDKYFGGRHNVSDIKDPIGTITTGKTPSLNTIQFLQSNYTRKTPTVRSIDSPLRTITTSINPSLISVELIQFISKHFGGNHAASIENPLPTITTIDHNTLCSCYIGNGIYLLDIKMRWLTPRELASCQGFPEDYKLIGTKSEQIKGIGNSISPKIITALMNSITSKSCKEDTYQHQ